MDKSGATSRNEHLRQERIRRNWRQQDVAEQLGTAVITVKRWERGSQQPSAYFRAKLCALFSKSAEELGFVSGDPPPVCTGAEGGALVEGFSGSSNSQYLWNVPFRRNPFFTGREHILLHLHETLHAGKMAALIQTQAISGLGGIGKTQTAVEYAYRFRDDYSAVLWVRAETCEVLFADFVMLAALLNLTEKDEQDQHRVVNAVKQWLNNHSRWLLILDNVEDFIMVNDFLPSESSGHILMTTRAQSTGTFAQSIDMEQMDIDEGALFLLRRAKLIEHEALLEDVANPLRIQAREISELLGGLPLALDQTGAYIEETGCDLSDYLDRYETRRTSLLNRRGNVIADHPESVRATFSLSLEKVERADPAAVELLRMCAFLAADAIPEEIITEGASELNSILQTVAVDKVLLDDALAAVRKYSLLYRNPETKTLTIHRLVQAVLKDQMDEATQRQWAECVVRAVNRIFPNSEDVSMWPLCQRYLPHALFCMELIDQWNMVSSETGRLLHQTGIYLMQRSQYTQAQLLLEKALAIHVQMLGAEHLDVGTNLNDLAMLYYQRGEYEQVKPLFQQALTIREKSLGAEHPDIGTSLNDLAMLYYQRGEYEQAEPLFQQALVIYEKALEVEHPYVAATLNNLGRLYVAQGEYERAEPLYQRVLTISEKTLEPEDFHRAIGLNNLGKLYAAQGKHEQAEPLYQQALIIYEKTLGPESPYVAISLNSLARLYVEQNQYDQAEPLLQRALAIYEKVLGPGNIRSTQSLNDLANLYFKQGKYTQAEPFYQQALMIREKVLGQDHPDVATTLENYAALLFETKREVEATKLLERVEKIRAQHTQMNIANSSRHRGMRKQKSQYASDSPIALLGTREREILCMIVAGKTNQEIAQELVLALSTVKWHLKNIYSKLNMSNRVQLILHFKDGF